MSTTGRETESEYETDEVVFPTYLSSSTQVVNSSRIFCTSKCHMT